MSKWRRITHLFLLQVGKLRLHKLCAKCLHFSTPGTKVNKSPFTHGDLLYRTRWVLHKMSKCLHNLVQTPGTISTHQENELSLMGITLLQVGKLRLHKLCQNVYILVPLVIDLLIVPGVLNDVNILG